MEHGDMTPPRKTRLRAKTRLTIAVTLTVAMGVLGSDLGDTEGWRMGHKLSSTAWFSLSPALTSVQQLVRPKSRCPPWFWPGP